MILLHGRFLKDVKRFLGEQIGSYFGHSLTVGDFNGDGLEDFSVGAPLFSDKKISTHESGRVYVIYQNENQVSNVCLKYNRGSQRNMALARINCVLTSELHRDRLKCLYVVARSLFLLLLTCSAQPWVLLSKICILFCRSLYNLILDNLGTSLSYV